MDSCYPRHVTGTLDDAYVATLATALTGELGGKVGVVPRVFATKFVSDVLDRVDQFEECDPRQDYKLTISDTELTDQERGTRGATSADDIDLGLEIDQQGET